MSVPSSSFSSVASTRNDQTNVDVTAMNRAKRDAFERTMIYNCLRNNDFECLEDLRRRWLSAQWQEGYQNVPVVTDNWKQQDPIMKALFKPPYPYIRVAGGGRIKCMPKVIWGLF